MKTVDDEILDDALKFAVRQPATGKPFFMWLNPTRMHMVTPPLAKNTRNAHVRERLDRRGGRHGAARRHRRGRDAYLKSQGQDGNTIVVVSTDNGAENFTWPDGGKTPFAGAKGTVMEGGFRVPVMVRWPGHVPAGKVENGIMSGLDWFPTFVAAAGDPNIADELQQGKKIGDSHLQGPLDGYNQMDLITGKGPSNRHEIFYFAETTLGAVRINDFKFRFIDQPGGWLGGRSMSTCRSSSISGSIHSSEAA